MGLGLYELLIRGGGWTRFGCKLGELWKGRLEWLEGG